jgi:energy-coupling factor transporter ATP-binding protein EcfA2
MYDIVIGRNKKDREKYGLEGTFLLAKHYVKMGQTTSLSNKVYMDITRSHIVFVCGKRGSGKSYSLGVIAEGLIDLPPEIRRNLAIVLVDTMGIYWTMKYPNKKDGPLLKEWGLDAKGLDIKIYTPKDFYDQYKLKGIPTDVPFSIRTSELTGSDWCLAFDVGENDRYGVLIDKAINELHEKLADDGIEYDLDTVIAKIESISDVEGYVKAAVINKFANAKQWGLFTTDGTKLEDLVKGGQVTVLDVSPYATIPNGWNIKSLVLGLVSQKLFNQRMRARKDEEYNEIQSTVHYFSEDSKQKQTDPLVWLVIDEAHEFLPKEGKTAASDPLITILREGRQPGISLVLATQQPGKIHTDVMTQSDTVFAHRLTAKIDVDALSTLMQSYMRKGLDQELDNLPRVQGAGVIFDDSNEKMYPIRVRPRFTWHGGESPTAMSKKKKLGDF